MKLKSWDEFKNTVFKCRECEWEGKESEMKNADNGIDYSNYCPKCGDCMVSNNNYYCDEVKTNYTNSPNEPKQ